MYLKSKEQLVGIIKSMIDKLLDDKLTTTFQQQQQQQQQQAEVDKTIAEMQARPVTAAKYCRNERFHFCKQNRHSLPTSNLEKNCISHLN